MRVGLLARIEAKPEHVEKVEGMLRDAVALAEQEDGTVTWYSFRQDATTFGVFDTFDDEDGRRDHLEGKIAAALMGVAETLLSAAPVITPIDVLAAKKA